MDMTTPTHSSSVAADADESFNSSAPGTPSSSSAAGDAQARREARKARILGKGNDRLAKLTKQARGEEADKIYPATVTPTSSAAVRRTQLRSDEDDPEEVDISGHTGFTRGAQVSDPRQQRQDQSDDPMQMMINTLMGGFTGAPDGKGGPPGSGQGTMPDLAQLFAAFNGSAAAELPPQLDADGNPLPAVQGFPPGIFDQQMAAGVEVAKPPSFTELATSRLMSFLHPVLLLSFAYLVLSSMFAAYTVSNEQEVVNLDASYIGTAVDGNTPAMDLKIKLYKWASLAYFKPTVTEAAWYEVDGSWFGKQGGLPIFYPLLVLSLTTHLSTLLLAPPKPVAPSLVFSIASALPIPALRVVLRLFSKYARVLAKVIDDMALLVFLMGMGVLYCASTVSSAGVL